MERGTADTWTHSHCSLPALNRQEEIENKDMKRLRRARNKYMRSGQKKGWRSKVGGQDVSKAQARVGAETCSS